MNRYFTRLAHIYLMVALVIPALIPAGYMIGKDPSSGLVEITICSAVNHRQVLLDLKSGQWVDRDDANSHSFSLPDSRKRDQQTPEGSTSELCPFALAASVLLVAQFSDAIDHATFLNPEVPRTFSSPTLNTSTPPLPARGPPTLV